MQPEPCYPNGPSQKQHQWGLIDPQLGGSPYRDFISVGPQSREWMGMPNQPQAQPPSFYPNGPVQQQLQPGPTNPQHSTALHDFIPVGFPRSREQADALKYASHDALLTYSDEYKGLFRENHHLRYAYTHTSSIYNLTRASREEFKVAQSQSDTWKDLYEKRCAEGDQTQASTGPSHTEEASNPAPRGVSITTKEYQQLFPLSYKKPTPQINRTNVAGAYRWWTWEEYLESGLNLKAKKNRAYTFLQNATGDPLSKAKKQEILDFANDIFNRVHAISPDALMPSYKKVSLELRTNIQCELTARFDVFQYCDDNNWKAYKYLVDLHANWNRGGKKRNKGKKIKSEPTSLEPMDKNNPGKSSILEMYNSNNL